VARALRCRNWCCPALACFALPVATAIRSREIPLRVREDVVDGLISAEMAKDDYGIVLAADGTIDEPATARWRRDMISRSDARG
jgi:hypothetical protein